MCALCSIELFIMLQSPAGFTAVTFHLIVSLCLCNRCKMFGGLIPAGRAAQP
jgi:hypothetical protein